MPIIPPNNTTGLYGVDTTVSINNNVYANNLVLTGSADVAGNVTANYFIGNGSQLTGLAATYSNANVAAFLANFGSNTISTTGNITGGNISGTHLGSGAGLSSLTGANVTGTVPAATVATTVTANAQPNITSTGVLTSVSVTGNVTSGNVVVNQDVSVTGSVTAGVYYGTFAGNISGNIVAPGSNTWVLYNNNGTVAGDSDFRFDQANSSMTVTGNVQSGNVSTTNLTATGTVSAANLVGNGAQISSITGANVTGTVANAAFATAAATAGTVTTNAQPNITSVGTLSGLTVTNTITGNITGSAGTAATAGTVTTNAQPNITSVGILTALSVSGNITGANVTGTHFGSGAALSSLTGANVTGTVANATFATSAGSAGTATSAVTAGTVTTAAQPNITSVGILSSLSVSGNISGNSALSVTGNIISNNLATNNVGAAAITATGNITSTAGTVSGNLITGNIADILGNANVGGVLQVSGNIEALGSRLRIGTILTTGDINTQGQGNVVAVNVTGVGNVSAVGNVSGTYILGNGAFLSGIAGTYGNAQVANFLPTYTGAMTSMAGNLTTTANVSGAYILGNGSALTSITGAAVTGTVANATYATTAGTASTANTAATANTVTTNAQPNITSVGTLTSVTVTGNVSSGNVTATGNISANYVLGNGSQLTGLPTLSLAGNMTGNIDGQGYQISNLANLATTGTAWIGPARFQINSFSPSELGLTVDAFNTSSAVNVGGNLTAGNIVIGNSSITSTAVAAQFLISTSNSIIGNLQINKITDGANGIQQLPNNSSLTSNISGAQPGRVVFGAGYDGNLVHTGISTELSTSSRLVTLDKITLPQTQTNPARVAGMAGQLSIDLAGSTWTNKRASGYRFDLQLGNGTANTPNYNNIRAAAYNIVAGNSSPSNIGNANIVTVSGVTSGMTVGDNSRIGNALTFVSIGAFGAGSNTVANSQIGYGFVGGSGTAAGDNVIGFYFNGTTNRFGLAATANLVRQATNYYAFVNDDPIAQMQLGSIRSAHTYTGVLSSQSGNITIDKANGQTQILGMAANVTITGYSNLVTTVSNGATSKTQTDVLTILVPPNGSTLTLPTGASYKYLAGNSTVPNSGTNWVRITVTATDNGSAVYLTTIDDYT
jgi:hypothetical protein